MITACPCCRARVVSRTWTGPHTFVEGYACGGSYVWGWCTGERWQDLCPSHRPARVETLPPPPPIPHRETQEKP